MPATTGTTRFPLIGPLPGKRLVEDLRAALQRRWGDYVAWNVVREEVATEFGEEMVPVSCREVLDIFGAKVTELRDGLERVAGGLELGPPTEEQLESARKMVDLDALKPTPKPGEPKGRPWMPDKDRAELEYLETRLAAELRAKKD